MIHGDADAIVPFEVSGHRAAEAVPGAQVALVEGAPQSLDVSHAKELNRRLPAFLEA